MINYKVKLRVLMLLFSLCFFLSFVVYLQVDEVESLIKRLEDKNVSIWSRIRAAETLGRTKDPRAIEPLRTALRDEEHPIVREWIEDTLKKLESD